MSDKAKKSKVEISPIPSGGGSWFKHYEQMQMRQRQRQIAKDEQLKNSEAYWEDPWE